MGESEQAFFDVLLQAFPVDVAQEKPSMVALMSSISARSLRRSRTASAL